ncbi:BrnA antitoxin family protein [Treponema vincentii]
MENVWYDADILTALQSRGKGYQTTRINKILRKAIMMGDY